MEDIIKEDTFTDSVRGLFDKGVKLFEDTQFNTAIEFFNQILSADPRHIHSLLYKGESLRNIKEDNAAMVCFDVVLLLDWKNLFALEKKAIFLLKNGDFEELILLCEKILNLTSDNAICCIAFCLKGMAKCEQGLYQEAEHSFKEALSIRPEDGGIVKARTRNLELSKLGDKKYVVPFSIAIKEYDQNSVLFDLTKRALRKKLVEISESSNKPIINQLCEVLDLLFTLRFLDQVSGYDENKFGERIVNVQKRGWVFASEDDLIFRNILFFWTYYVRKLVSFLDQLTSIEYLNYQLLRYYSDVYRFSLRGVDKSSLMSLLWEVRKVLFTYERHEKFLLLLLKLDLGVAREWKNHGILTCSLFDGSEELKKLMEWTIEEVKSKYFNGWPEGFNVFLNEIRKKEQQQFYDLRQKQLDRPYNGFYVSSLPTVKAGLPLEMKRDSVNEKIKEVVPNIDALSSAKIQETSHEKSLIPAGTISEETKINELLNRIDTNGNDTKEFGGIYIYRSDVRFNCFDKNSDYTADFINLLLYPLKKSHLESIAIYPVTTLKELPKYFEDIDAQKQRYAFITLHVPYNLESPIDNNHWASLILDKEEQIIFYLDPATVNMPPAVEDLRSQLKYEKPIAINPIDLQKAEKLENKIRHCGVYIVEIFKVFAQCIRSNQTIIDTKNPIESVDKEHVSLSNVLESIPHGLKEAAIHRQNHIDVVCGILKTLPPVTLVAESEPRKKRPLAIVKTDPEEMIRFCFRINVMEDKAQLAIIAFHEVLLGRLESRKTTSEVMSSGIISYTEKGNWAKLKKAGWMILKSVPIAGKVLKYGHVGCQIAGEGLSTLADRFPWIECIGLIGQFLEESEAPWIEPVTDHLETVKSVSKGCHGIINLLDHLKMVKAFHGKVDDYFRKWIDGSEVDTYREYKQFYSIFRADAGKDALNRFVHNLIDRYSRQLQLLEPEGAKQLAKAIDKHLGQLFLLNFERWKLPQWGAQKHTMMLDIMRQWVTYMEFQKKKKVLLASGETATAEALLQHCGVYFEGDQRPIEINVMMGWDAQTKSASMTNSGRYGYRKAENLLVEEFKDHLQNSGQLLQAYETQFAGQKNAEELEMFKELGHVMGVQFDSRTLSAFQQLKEVKACDEVVWQSERERLGESEKKLCVVENKLEDVEEAVGVITEKVEHLDSENKKFVTQETYDKDMELMQEKLTDAENKAGKAEQAAAAANKAAVEANKALASVQTELQEVKVEKEKLQKELKNERCIREQQTELLCDLILEQEKINPTLREKAIKLRQATSELKKPAEPESPSQNQKIIDRNEHNNFQTSFVENGNGKKDEQPDPALIPPILQPTIEPMVFNSPISQVSSVSTQSMLNSSHQQRTEDKTSQDEVTNTFSLETNERVCFPDWYMARLN